MNWDHFIQVGNFAGALWPYLLVLGAVVAVLRKTIKNAIHELVQNEIKPIQEQFQNNGGSSMKDQIDGLVERADRTEGKVDVVVEKQDEQTETLKEHTASDTANFSSINNSFNNVNSTLFALIQGQASARAKAEEVAVALEVKDNEN